MKALKLAAAALVGFPFLFLLLVWMLGEPGMWIAGGLLAWGLIMAKKWVMGDLR